MSEGTRHRLYKISLAVVPVLVAYGYLAEAEAAVWVGLLGSIFSSGLAVKNTSAD